MGKLTKSVKQVKNQGYKFRINGWEKQYLQNALPLDDIGAYQPTREYFEMQAYFLRRIWQRVASIYMCLYDEKTIKLDNAHASALRIWAISHTTSDTVGHVLKIRIILETGQIL